MNKIKVSAVCYTNSKPFVYGIMHSGILDQIDLSLDIPSVCANKLVENQVDIGLVPVAALLQIKDYQIISNYCIGAKGSVDSVFIFSHKPIQEIKTLQLDSQSRTSNNLSRVLLKHHWKISPELVNTGAADSFVQIGDRTFGNRNHYPYQYDLAAEWYEYTGLPFVFAVWASNKPIPEDFKLTFNAALKYGLEHRRDVIAGLEKIDNFDLDDYLMKKIDFNLDNEKLLALSRFHELIKTL
ncbi:MAG: menaquinone biosynthesis protein [Pedobacter sp.]